MLLPCVIVLGCIVLFVLVSVGCLLWCVGVGEMLGIGLVVFVGVLGREIWVKGKLMLANVYLFPQVGQWLRNTFYTCWCLQIHTKNVGNY